MKNGTFLYQQNNMISQLGKTGQVKEAYKLLFTQMTHKKQLYSTPWSQSPLKAYKQRTQSICFVLHWLHRYHYIEIIMRDVVIYWFHYDA